MLKLALNSLNYHGIEWWMFCGISWGVNLVIVDTTFTIDDL